MQLPAKVSKQAGIGRQAGDKYHDYLALPCITLPCFTMDVVRHIAYIEMELYIYNDITHISRQHHKFRSGEIKAKKDIYVLLYQWQW
jgi:hypothetical protein